MATVSELCATGDVSEVKTWLATDGNLLTVEEAETVGQFVTSQVDNAIVISLWRAGTKQTHNIILLHPHICDRTVAAALGNFPNR